MATDEEVPAQKTVAQNLSLMRMLFSAMATWQELVQYNMNIIFCPLALTWPVQQILTSWSRVIRCEVCCGIPQLWLSRGIPLVQAICWESWWLEKFLGTRVLDLYYYCLWLLEALGFQNLAVPTLSACVFERMTIGQACLAPCLPALRIACADKVGNQQHD